jgi:hypothetical protein
MLVNWGLEAKKWQVLLSDVEQISFLQGIKAVLAGLSFGLLTPNRIGNFVGKILYLDPVNRIRGTLYAFYGNFSQLVTTLLFGSFVFAFYHKDYFDFYNPGIAFLPLLFSIGFLVLFFLPKIIRVPISEKVFSKEMIGNFGSIQSFDRKMEVFGLAISRHLVFTTQYLIVLSYSPYFSFLETLIAVQFIFLFTTVIPSIIFGKIIIRESVGVFILIQLGYDTSFIVSAVLFIWFINIAIPSLFGSFLFLIKKKG